MIPLQELSQFHKREVLERLRRALAGMTIADLKFRSAAWKITSVFVKLSLGISPISVKANSAILSTCHSTWARNFS